VDVEAFEEATVAAHRARDPGSYQAALDLYAGALMPEDLYEGWTVERREELRQSYLGLLVELARAYESRNEHGPAIEAFQRLAAAEPAAEEAHAGLIRLYALSGQRGEALRQYECLREALQ
jgi:DNA-binding SARP family transcriptional activator